MQRHVSLALLTLKDGRIVFQRRDDKAPVSPNKLGMFGGKVEADESYEEAMRRELVEETSLRVNELNITHVTDYTLRFPDMDIERTFHLYWAELENAEFEVYEGVGAEVYTRSEALARDDLTPSATHVLTKILKEK